MNNKFIVFAMLFLGLAFFVNINTAAADPGVIYVNASSGNDAWTGQYQFVNGTNGPKKTISGGTSAVTANGVVNIANGNYTGASNRGITIAKNMTIKGQSKDGTIINGSNTARIFIVNSGVNLSLLNLTIANGRSSGNDFNGGAIKNNGNLTINNVNFKNNYATKTTGSNNVSGGAIYNTGILNVVGSTFTNNYAQSGSSNNAQGGAIYSTGTLIINNSSFTGNYVNSASGTAADEGGALWSTGISNITNSNFINNRATDGGAILNGNSMNITSSNFTNNTATDDGGAIANGNEVVPGGTVVIKNSNFINNTGVYGGAIWNTAIMTITNSTLRNNTAKYGGAVRTWGTLNMTSNTIVDNTVTSGGNGAAVSVRSGTANVNFNIIMGNTGSYEVYLESGSLNASNNVWNSTNQGNVNITTWLVLRLTSSPSNILSGGSSTITADLNHDQNGVYYDPADGHIPDGIPITFNTNLGTINSAVMNNGTASVIFNAGYVPGVATITATTNGYTNNTTVTVSSLANVRINQTVNTPVNVGDKVTFLVTATNNGPNTATNINIRDIIPAGLTGVIFTPSLGTYNSTTGIWTIPSLLNGSSAVLNITGMVSASMAGIITNNTATEINQTENNTQLPTNTVGVYTKKANVVLSQTVNSPVNVGGTVTYIIRATNNGPDNATNIIINNVLQSGLSGVSYTPSVGSYSNGVWTIPYLANGSIASLTITGIATSSMAGTNITNNVSQTNQTEFSDSFTNSSLKVYTKSVDVAISHNSWYTDLYSYNYGSAPVFTVRATNNGPDEASGVVVEYKIGRGFQLITCNPYQGTVSFNSATNTITWNIGYMPVSGRTYLYVYLKVIETGNNTVNLTNNASLKNVEQFDRNLANNAVTRSIYVAPAADVQVNQSTQQKGSNLTITITATNNGPNNANSIQISDNLPSGLINASFVPSLGTYSNGIWTISSLANGATATLVINAIINQTTGTLKNTATKISQVEVDWDLNNNAQTCLVTLSGNYTKSVDVAISHNSWYTDLYSYNYGSAPVFTVRATNNGPDEASGVVVEYKIGRGFQLITCNPYQGTVSFNSATNTITWNIGYMPVSGRTYLYVYLKVIETGNNTVNLTNNASLKNVEQFDRNLANNAVTRSIYVAPAADVQVNQSTQQKGSNLTITITATNNAPDSANLIQISENIPPELYNVTVTPSVGTYSNGIWSIPVLEYGEIATLTIQGTFSQTNGVIKNTATKISQVEVDWDLNNNAQTVYI